MTAPTVGPYLVDTVHCADCVDWLRAQTYNTMGRGDFAYVSAQNQRDEGTIYCEIFVNGVSWKRSQSSGAYVIASCSGRVGD